MSIMRNARCIRTHKVKLYKTAYDKYYMKYIPLNIIIMFTKLRCSLLAMNTESLYSWSRASNCSNRESSSNRFQETNVQLSLQTASYEIISIY